jgi:outer membrane translocation and assembly module TamA
MGDTLSVRVQGQRYREPMLLEERRRILTFLQNEGYAAVSRDSVRAVVYRATPDSFDVTLRVQTGPRYRFGDVRFEATGPEDAPPRSDTVDVAVDTTGGGRPQVTARFVDERRLDPAIVRRSLRFTPGAYYDQSAVQATKRRLDGTGVFAFTNLSPQYEDAVRRDTTGAPYLPLQINAQTRQRHRLQAETFALQRESVGAREAGVRLNEFGVGLSGTYENVNAFGGGETFRLRTSASVATGLDSLLVSSNQFEGSASLVLPYLIRPFQSLDRTFDLSSARTRLSLTGLTALRTDLGLRIRSRVNAQLRLEMDHTPTQSSLVDVVDLSLSNPDTLDQFSKKFLRRVLPGAAAADSGGLHAAAGEYGRPVHVSGRHGGADAAAERTHLRGIRGGGEYASPPAGSVRVYARPPGLLVAQSLWGRRRAHRAAHLPSVRPGVGGPAAVRAPGEWHHARA